MMSTQMKPLSIPPYTSSKPPNNNNSPSKSSDSNSESLSERCRRLAASLGDKALHDHQFEHTPDILSPINTSPTRRASSQLPNLPIYSNPTNFSNNHNRNHSPNSNSTGTGSDCGNGLEGIDEDPNEGKYNDEEELLFGTVPSQLLETASSSSLPKSLFSPSYSLGLSSTTSSGILNSPIVLDESDEDEEDAITPTRLGLPLSKENEQAEMIREGLKAGDSTIRVKCWLIDGELLYGNDRATLSPTDTLYSGYINPLHKLLTPGYQKGHHRRRSSSFSQITPTSPLQLILYFQNEPATAFQFLLHDIKALHDDSLLTTFCPRSNLTFPGLVTVLVAEEEGQVGMVPKEEIESLSPRYVFESGKM